MLIPTFFAFQSRAEPTSPIETAGLGPLPLVLPGSWVTFSAVPEVGAVDTLKAGLVEEGTGGGKQASAATRPEVAAMTPFVRG